MLQSVELVRAILPDHVRSSAEAESVLAAARLIGVDPIDYCMHRFDVSVEEVMGRAARWAGLSFRPYVPGTGKTAIEAYRIDRLGEMRSIRLAVKGQEILFLAPRFNEFIGLKSYAASQRDVC